MIKTERNQLSSGMKKALQDVLNSEDSEAQWHEGLIILTSRKTLNLLDMLTLHYAATTGHMTLNRNGLVTWLIHWQAQRLLGKTAKKTE